MQPVIRPKENLNGWNVFFSILFAVLLFFVVAVIGARYGGFPRAVPPVDIILMLLASFRITRLLTYDKITRWLRELFLRKRELIAEDGSRWVELTPIGSGARHDIHDLLQCPWCVGVWSALVVVFAYFMFPWAWMIIFMLAVAGAGSFVQVSANAIGWKAENLKQDLQAKSGQ